MSNLTLGQLRSPMMTQQPDFSNKIRTLHKPIGIMIAPMKKSAIVNEKIKMSGG